MSLAVSTSRTRAESADPAPVAPAPEPRVRSRRRHGTRGLKLRQRLGVILFGLVVVCAVVGLSFLVGYIVGKIFL
jgi:hypothetical protein